MKKEGYELPAECVQCKSVFELNDDLIGEDWNKTIGDVLIEKYGSDLLMCPKCRKMVRIIEEGTFKWVIRGDKDGRMADLELVSKEGNRRLWKVKSTTKKSLLLRLLVAKMNSSDKCKLNSVQNKLKHLFDK